MPPLCAQARKYLDFLASHPSLTRKEVEKAIGSGAGSAERWSQAYKEDFRGEEATIRARHKVAESKRRQAADSIRRGEPQAGGPAPVTAELAGPLDRFLELYGIYKNRTKALELCRQEGVDVQWDDVARALKTDREFFARFEMLFERVLIEIEDGVINKARDGQSQAAITILKAKRPREYGNKLRVTVDGGLQLGVADRQAVEEVKSGAVARWRDRAAKSAAGMVQPVVAEDVIEGEFVEEAGIN